MNEFRASTANDIRVYRLIGYWWAKRSNFNDVQHCRWGSCQCAVPMVLPALLHCVIVLFELQYIYTYIYLTSSLQYYYTSIDRFSTTAIIMIYTSHANFCVKQAQCNCLFGKWVNCIPIFNGYAFDIYGD